MYRGDVQYCPEDDILFPTLTVDSTVHFAAQTRAPQPRIENQTRREYTRLITDVYTTIFGLSHVKGTLVGDAAIRGVSGGEKKRVSISETLATRSLITSWDKQVSFFPTPSLILTYSPQLNERSGCLYSPRICSCSPYRHRSLTCLDHSFNLSSWRDSLRHLRQGMRHL